VQYVLRDPALSRELDREMLRRVVPEMDKAFGYRPARREDYRIACYDAAEGGSLPAHRDNPTENTRHRRFTVSVNLNNHEFEGGELAFREYSDHLYDVEAGTAIVWSCSLLHEVMPVTAGRRFILGAHLFG
jgi:predicted 2-oxoglutarate/Fe(II)-dependent dioxygenase YbiX